MPEHELFCAVHDEVDVCTCGAIFGWARTAAPSGIPASEAWAETAAPRANVGSSKDIAS